MSNKELAINLIDSEVEEVEPDEIDLQMIKEAERVNDGNYITIDALSEQLNLKKL